MRRLLLILFLFNILFTEAQHRISNTGRVLITRNDTVIYSYTSPKGESFSIPFVLSQIANSPPKRTILNNEREGWPGKHVFTTTGDSILLASTTEQAYVFKLTNGKDTVDIYLNFVNTSPLFTPAHISATQDKVIYEIPKAFELANVILALTDTGKADDNLVLKPTRYYKAVQEHFGKYSLHPVVQYVNYRFAHENKYGIYYDARNMTLGYTLHNNTITPHDVYPERWGQNFWTMQTHLLSDFAHQTNFDSFYTAHKLYYDSLITLQQQYVPVRQMWQWLQKEFPYQYDAYRIRFSPLINGAHNTERYEANNFKEVLVYVSGAEKVKERDPKVKEGLMSGIVFTEIDHNYVNPHTDKYKEQVNKVFGDRKHWTAEGGDNENYYSPAAVFNEYMTHALFCLYASKHYPAETFTVINETRERLMVEQRKFTRFRQFSTLLRDIYNTRKPGETVADLYPLLLEQAAAVR